MRFLIKILITALAVIAAEYFFPEAFAIKNFMTALLVGLVLGLLNAIVKPILIILTIPITIVTLGLFLLVINAMVIELADYLISGFSVKGFWWALALSLFISLLNSMATKSDEKEKRRQEFR